MWDILRFLKNPDGELNRDDAVRTNAEAEKKSVDSRLIESLADSRPADDQEGLSRNENAFLADEVASERIRAHISSNTVPGEANAAPVKKTAPQAAPKGVITKDVPVGSSEPAAAGPSKAAPARQEDRPVPEKPPAQRGERLLKLPLSDIKPNPFQPRKVMGENEITELSESIRELGVLQPILVKYAESGYELVAGERRLRAAQRAGLSEIPAVLIETEPLTQQIIALVENIQRKNLSAIEEAVCLRDIQEKTGWSQTEISRRMGRSQASIANKLRLLRLDPSVQELVISGKLGERQARSLLSLSVDEQKLLAQKAIDEDLSARTLETLAENWGDHQPQAKRAEKKKQSSSDGPAGELLGDLAALVTRHRNNGVSAQWRVKQMNQSSLVVEISVDLMEGAAAARVAD
jgi:ParB family chromosome partitioning protein